jgi:hypothetical protein
MMAQPQLPAEERFKTNNLKIARDFVDIISRLVNNNFGIDIGLAGIAEDYLEKYSKVNPHTSVRNFIVYSYPFWDAVADRNRDILLNNMALMLGPDSASVAKPFAELFRNNVFTKQQEDDIWVMFHASVKISLSYWRDNKLTNLECRAADGRQLSVVVDFEKYARKFKMRGYC